MVEIPTVPMTLYHPVYGAVSAETLEDAARIFQPDHDWFKTPEEADAHRTENEAAQVILNGRINQIKRHTGADLGVVRHSVTHQETVDRQAEVATAEAAATGAEPPKDDGTRGAELLG